MPTSKHRRKGRTRPRATPQPTHHTIHNHPHVDEATWARRLALMPTGPVPPGFDIGWTEILPHEEAHEGKLTLHIYGPDSDLRYHWEVFDADQDDNWSTGMADTAEQAKAECLKSARECEEYDIKIDAEGRDYSLVPCGSPSPHWTPTEPRPFDLSGIFD